MARECAHPDAQWLASLFPAEGPPVSRKAMADVMRQHPSDARAVFLVWAFVRDEGAMLVRAAEMGYAPAQAQMSIDGDPGDDTFSWATRGEAQGDRRAKNVLAYCYDNGEGCERDLAKAAQLYEQAAERGCPSALYVHGKTFGPHDWRRFHYWGRAKTGQCRYALREGIIPLLPLFEAGQLGRVLHVAAPALRRNVYGVAGGLYRTAVTEDDESRVTRVLQLHGAMLDRARQAIACWSVVGRRLGLVKDMRVVIAKMVWEEAWRWGERVERGTWSAPSCVIS
jgi:hypothetical protein